MSSEVEQDHDRQEETHHCQRHQPVPRIAASQPRVGDPQARRRDHDQKTVSEANFQDGGEEEEWQAQQEEHDDEADPDGPFPLASLART
jgi:hypothetical protein